MYHLHLTYICRKKASNYRGRDRLSIAKCSNNSLVIGLVFAAQAHHGNKTGRTFKVKTGSSAVGGESESFRSSCLSISKLPHEMAAFDIVYLVKVRGKNLNRASEKLQNRTN